MVDDPVQLRGSGLVAFGTFAFADDSAATSVLIVPRVVVGRRRGKAWLTAIDTTPDPAPLAFTRTSVPVPHVGPHLSVALRPRPDRRARLRRVRRRGRPSHHGG